MSNLKKRLPSQKRSIKTKDKLLKSGIKLFIKKGCFNTNSKEIALAAGVAVGSFYAYFDDKKDILIEIYSIIVKDIENNLISSISENTDLKEKKGIIANIVKGLMGAEHLKPTLYHEIQVMALFDKDINNLVKTVEKRFCNVIRTAFLSWKDDLVVNDLDYAVILVFKIFEQIIVTYVSSPQNYDKEKYFSEVTDVIYGYLFKEK